MTKDVNAQLRITIWPAARLPLPATWRFVPRLDGSGDVILPRTGEFERGARTYPVTLSGETYLRVCELDLQDPAEILAFVASYGALGGGLAHIDLATDESGEADESWSGALDPAAERTAKEAAVDAERVGMPVVRIHPGPPPMATARGGYVSIVDFEPPVVETLNEFRFAAHCIRDLTTAWDVVREGGDPSWTLESVANPIVPPTRETAGMYLSAMLTRSLKRLSPRLSVSSWFSGLTEPDDLKELYDAGNVPYDEFVVEPLREPSELPLYVLCALELFNHILSGATYHVCANDRCLRRFVHQQGRAEKGQHRSSGVRYCSPACARATAQREWRRRRREQPSK